MIQEIWGSTREHLMKCIPIFDQHFSLTNCKKPENQCFPGDEPYTTGHRKNPVPINKFLFLNPSPQGIESSFSVSIEYYEQSFMLPPHPNPPACEYEQEISTCSAKKRKSKHHSFCCNFGVIKYLLTYGWLER
jgi:hypothetical protein